MDDPSTGTSGARARGRGGRPPRARLGRSGPAAAVGPGGVARAPRGGRRGAPGATSDGAWRGVRPLACARQRTPDDGGAHVEPEALRAFGEDGTAGMTSTCIG